MADSSEGPKQPQTGPLPEPASPRPVQEESTAMLDVHPARHAAHTWTDFFIHIATIVVGLLIAVGLEQTVEHIHQRYALRDTQQSLEREREANEKDWARNETDWRNVFVELKNNLAVLNYIRQHPKTAQTALPGELQWYQSAFMWKHAFWDAAQQKGMVQLMPHATADDYQEFYRIMSTMSEQSLQAWNAINDAHRFDLLDPDPTHLTPPQLDEVIQLTLIALQKHVQFGYTFGRFANEFPQRPHTITWDTIEALRPTPSEADPQGMAAAHQKTMQRLKGANSGPNGTSIDPQALQ